MMSIQCLVNVCKNNSNKTIIMLSSKCSVSRETTQPRSKHDGLSVRVPRGLKNPLCFKLAKRFSTVREHAGISRYRLSALAGLANNHAARLENGSVIPTIETVERYASVFGVSPGWLAYGHEGMEPFRDRYPRPLVERSDPVPDDSLRVFRSLSAGFPERLRISRERSGLSMRILSAAAGVSVQAWSIAEGGRVVPLVDTCERMAVALGVAPSWLAFGEGIVN